MCTKMVDSRSTLVIFHVPLVIDASPTLSLTIGEARQCGGRWLYSGDSEKASMDREKTYRVRPKYTQFFLEIFGDKY